MLVDVLQIFSMRSLSLKGRDANPFFPNSILLVTVLKFLFLEAPFFGALFLPINVGRCHG